jgi:hypothetical protein
MDHRPAADVVRRGLTGPSPEVMAGQGQEARRASAEQCFPLRLVEKGRPVHHCAHRSFAEGVRVVAADDEAKDPHPWAKQIRSECGTRSKMPPRILATIERWVSAGIPVIHRAIHPSSRGPDGMSHGCTNTRIPRSAQCCRNVTIPLPSRSRSPTWLPISTPTWPLRMHRSASRLLQLHADVVAAGEVGVDAEDVARLLGRLDEASDVVVAAAVRPR